MKTDIKVRWVERLRSEQDEQGRDMLRDADGKLCCLGVLTEIAADEGVVERLGVGGSNAFAYGVRDSKGVIVSAESAILHPAVAEWAGLPRRPSVEFDDGEVDEWEGRVADLDELNDGGMTFSQIADLIERHL